MLLAEDAAVLQHIPPDARKPDEAFSYCPGCGRVCWQGSLYNRIRAKLPEWNDALNAS